MNNKTLHYLYAGATAVLGLAQYVSPFIPANAMPGVLAGVGGLNALLHFFFPAGDPATAPGNSSATTSK